MAFDREEALRIRTSRERLDARIEALPSRALGGVIALLSEIEETRGWWSGLRGVPPAALRSRREATLRACAEASVRIGWTGLPRPDLTRPHGARGDRESGRALAILSAPYAAALRSVREAAGETAVSEDLFRSLHAGVLRGLPPGGDAPGVYRAVPSAFPHPVRRSAEWFALRPVPPEEIPREMALLASWARDRLAARAFHPLFVAAGVVLEFLAIRPFRTANGRTSRLLTTFLLLAAGYGQLSYAPLEKAIFERRAEYYVALRKSQSTLFLPRPDVSAWLIAFLSALRAQGRELRAHFGRRPDDARLSGNQARALDLLERRGEITTGLLMREAGLPRETAKQVLGTLAARGRAERVGAGRATRYRKPFPPP